MATQTDPTPVMLSSQSDYAIARVWSEGNTQSVNGSGAWPSAALAILVPFTLPFTYTAARAFVVNGTTANGNVDIGVYTTGYSRLLSTGNFAQAGTSTTQYATFSLILQPGTYYLALSLSSGTGTTFRSTGAGTTHQRLFGIMQMAAANPLPASITPVIAAQAYIPLFGLTRTSSGF